MHKLYLILIFLCLVFSFLNREARQRNLYLYFFVIFSSEILVYYKIFDARIYMYTKVFYIIFFLFYFKEFIKSKYNIYILLFIMISCIMIRNIIGRENLLPVMQCFIYVFLSLEWFTQQIKNPDETSIYDKQRFWFCLGLLLWSTVFIMRVIPSHFFANDDINFLVSVNYFYQGATIFSYIIFFIGLFCKK